jgi:tRNA-specific adenosine deaminase 1
MKCLPTTKIPHAHGNILHDWHAEVLAIRAFNRFLLDECLALLTPPYIQSRFIVRRESDEITTLAAAAAHSQPFSLREDVQIHMYCSEAPCGDASMELVMDAQEDATPWTTAPEVVESSINSSEITVLRGRSHFSRLGAVRLKPSRPDAPPTLSKSCTDKLTLHQCTSLLSSLTSLLISPKNAYITTLVLPRSQYVESACTRAFSASGRMFNVSSQDWVGGYRFRPFRVETTEREFGYSRRSVGVAERGVGCNLGAVCTPIVQRR